MGYPTYPVLVAAALQEMAASIQADRLPVPYSMTFSDYNEDPTIDITWMLQEDLEGTKKVIADFPSWGLHRGSDRHDLILECKVRKDGVLLDVSLWPHPDAVTIKVEAKS